jgi:hypothetical protein
MKDREIWIAAAAGVEALAGTSSVWSEPARVRKELAALVGALPATHVAIELAAVIGPDVNGGWGPLLGRAGGWAERLPELVQAIASAVAGRAVWGLVLPGPGQVARALGDESERGLVKAGLQVAAFLQTVRESGQAFVAVDAPATAEERAVGPILKNAGLYGWARALRVPDLGETRTPAADVWLVDEAAVADLVPLWAAGERVAGGLGRGFWDAPVLDGVAPARFALYGMIPAGTEPRAIVDAGRALRAWTAA